MDIHNVKAKQGQFKEGDGRVRNYILLEIIILNVDLPVMNY